MTNSKYIRFVTLFCVLLIMCFSLVGTAAANDGKMPDTAETQIKIGNGSGSGGGVTMKTSGSGAFSSEGGKIPLNAIIIVAGIIVIIGLAYYLLKKEK